jgi:hypothetical protein
MSWNYLGSASCNMKQTSTSKPAILGGAVLESGFWGGYNPKVKESAFIAITKFSRCFIFEESHMNIMFKSAKAHWQTMWVILFLLALVMGG